MKIYYHQFHGENVLTSPFTKKGVGFDIESLYSLKNLYSGPYTSCPSWKHKALRTFVVRSPINLSFNVEKESKSIFAPNLSEVFFNEYFKSTFNVDWCSDDAISIQLSVPRLIFWTKSKNIWVEQRAHPHTILNNFIGIGGWFNLSTWKRGINVSFDILDDKKPVNIKRGDILYELCFYSNDLNESVVLKRKEPSDKLIQEFIRTQSVKNYIPQVVHNLPFKNSKKECPFKSLLTNFE